ncbi:MAG: alpha/beta hydrolase [Erythrobacter sp.]
MKSKKVKAMLWLLGGLIAILAVAAIALQFAISRNGPAVLSAVDQLIGDGGEAHLHATISTGEHSAQKLLVWGPKDSLGGNQNDNQAGREELPVLLFAHGGSWRSGDPSDYGFVARSFVPKGFIVVLMGYRLHPDGVYPAMLEDTAAAIAWTKSEIAQYGGDPDHIVIAGHSAGAYNVVMAALEEQWLGRKGYSPSDIAGVVGLSGPYDFYPFDSESTQNAFGDAADPPATQPIAHVDGDAPPMLLIHGEKDTLVYPRNTRELAKRLTEGGSDIATRFYGDMEHNDPLISLAAPWRNSRDIDDQIANFALSLRASVPVQDEIR